MSLPVKSVMVMAKGWPCQVVWWSSRIHAQLDALEVSEARLAWAARKRPRKT